MAFSHLLTVASINFVKCLKFALVSSVEYELLIRFSFFSKIGNMVQQAFLEAKGNLNLLQIKFDF